MGPGTERELFPPTEWGHPQVFRGKNQKFKILLMEECGIALLGMVAVLIRWVAARAEK